MCPKLVYDRGLDRIRQQYGGKTVAHDFFLRRTRRDVGGGPYDQFLKDLAFSDDAAMDKGAVSAISAIEKAGGVISAIEMYKLDRWFKVERKAGRLSKYGAVWVFFGRDEGSAAINIVNPNEHLLTFNNFVAGDFVVSGVLKGDASTKYAITSNLSDIVASAGGDNANYGMYTLMDDPTPQPASDTIVMGTFLTSGDAAAIWTRKGATSLYRVGGSTAGTINIQNSLLTKSYQSLAFNRVTTTNLKAFVNGVQDGSTLATEDLGSVPAYPLTLFAGNNQTTGVQFGHVPSSHHVFAVYANMTDEDMKGMDNSFKDLATQTEANLYFNDLSSKDGKLSIGQQHNVDSLIRLMKFEDLWEGTLDIFPYMGGNVASAMTSLTLANNGINVNFTDDDVDPKIGIKPDASTKWFTMGINADVYWTSADDNQFGHYLDEDPLVSTEEYFIGVFDTNILPTDSIIGIINRSIDQARAYSGFVNLTAQYTPTVNSYRSQIGARYNASDLRLYLDGEMVAQQTNANTELLPPLEMGVFSRNLNGTFGDFASGTKSNGTFFAEGWTEEQLLKFDTLYRGFIYNIKNDDQYDLGAAAYFQSVQDKNGTLTAAEKAKVDSWFRAERAAGRLANHKHVLAFRGKTKDAAAINLVDPFNSITIDLANFVDADFVVAGKFEGDGTTKHGDYNQRLEDIVGNANDVQISLGVEDLNEIHGMLVGTAITSGLTEVFWINENAQSTADAPISFWVQNYDGLYARPNAGPASDIVVSARVSGTAMDINFNGVNVANKAAALSPDFSLIPYNLGLGCRIVNGTISSRTTATINFVVISTGLTNDELREADGNHELLRNTKADNYINQLLVDGHNVTDRQKAIYKSFFEQMKAEQLDYKTHGLYVFTGANNLDRAKYNLFKPTKMNMEFENFLQSDLNGKSLQADGTTKRAYVHENIIDTLRAYYRWGVYCYTENGSDEVSSQHFIGNRNGGTIINLGEESTPIKLNCQGNSTALAVQWSTGDDRYIGDNNSACAFKLSSTSFHLYKNQRLVDTETTEDASALPASVEWNFFARESSSAFSNISARAFAMTEGWIDADEYKRFDTLVKGFVYNLEHNVNYDLDAAAFLARLEREGATVSVTVQNALNQYVLDEKNSENWANPAPSYPMIGDTVAAKCVELKHPWNFDYDLTPNNITDESINAEVGFTFDGTTQWFDTPAMQDLGLSAQNNVFVYIGDVSPESSSGSNRYFYGHIDSVSTSGSLFIRVDNSGGLDDLSFASNSGTIGSTFKALDLTNSCIGTLREDLNFRGFVNRILNESAEANAGIGAPSAWDSEYGTAIGALRSRTTVNQFINFECKGFLMFNVEATEFLSTDADDTQILTRQNNYNAFLIRTIFDTLRPETQRYLNLTGLYKASVRQVLALDQFYADLNGAGLTPNSTNVLDDLFAIWVRMPTSLEEAVYNAKNPSKYKGIHYNFVSPDFTKAGLDGDGASKHTGIPEFTFKAGLDSIFLIGITSAKEAASSDYTIGAYSNAYIGLRQNAGYMGNASETLTFIGSDVPRTAQRYDDNKFKIFQNGLETAERTITLFTQFSTDRALALHGLGSSDDASTAAAWNAGIQTIDAIHKLLSDEQIEDLHDAIKRLDSNITPNGR